MKKCLIHFYACKLSKMACDNHKKISNTIIRLVTQENTNSKSLMVSMIMAWLMKQS